MCSARGEPGATKKSPRQVLWAEFVLSGCDGLWGCVRSIAVVDYNRIYMGCSLYEWSPGAKADRVSFLRIGTPSCKKLTRGLLFTNGSRKKQTRELSERVCKFAFYKRRPISPTFFRFRWEIHLLTFVEPEICLVLQ